MIDAVGALRVNADEALLVQTRFEQLLRYGYAVGSAFAVQAATVKLADARDVLPAPPPSGPMCMTDGTAASPDRNGYPQIQPSTADTQLREPMINAMTDMSSNPLADRSAVVTSYRSAYPSSYTHVYKQLKEVL